VQQLRKERGNKYKLTIRWIAGHEGADEKADREAKKAANGQSSVKSTLPKYLRKGIKSSVSARKQKREEGLNKAGKRSGSRQSDTRDSRQKVISVPSSKKYNRTDERTQVNAANDQLDIPTQNGACAPKRVLTQVQKSRQLPMPSMR